MRQLQLCAPQVGWLAERCCPVLKCGCWRASLIVNQLLVRHFQRSSWRACWEQGPAGNTELCAAAGSLARGSPLRRCAVTLVTSVTTCLPTRMARMHLSDSGGHLSAGTAEADIAAEEEDLESEDGDPDAGIGVLAPDNAAAKPARSQETAPASASKAIEQQQQRTRAKESAGFEEVPLGAGGAGGRGLDSSDDSDSDSDAGLAQMDDNSRAEVCDSHPLLLPRLP